MNAILILRDFFILCYRRFDYILKPLFKFILAFVVLLGLQSVAGYYEKLSSPAVIAIFALLAAFFPLGGISFMAGVFLVLDMFKVSYIMAAVGSGVLLLILLLYYGFKPGTGIVITLVPLAFIVGVPELVPVMLGLLIGIYSVVPAVCGVLSYSILSYFTLHVSELSAMGTDELVNDFLSCIRGVLLDKRMIILMAAMAAGIVTVSVVSRLSVNYARLISAVAGSIVCAALFIYAGEPIGSTALGTIASIALSVLYILVFYAADYRGTERLEFEDDDYFYYVKAVPKIKPEDISENL